MISLLGAVRVRQSAAVWALLLLAGCRENIPTPPGPAVEPIMDAGRDTRGGSGGGGGTGGSAGTGGSGGGAGAPADMNLVDRADARADADAGGAGDAGDARPDVMASGCGTVRPNIEGITNADSVAVGMDGTLYFNQALGADGFVGRLRPDGSPVEKMWLRVPMGARLRGLAFDSGRKRLYMASASGRAIHWVDPGAAMPALQNLITGLNNPNDIAVAANGDVYYSDQGDRHVHRVTPAGMRSMVTRTPVGPPYLPAGLAFGLDGLLYLGTSGTGPILRFQLVNGVEMSRESYGHYVGWGNGVAFDERGRLYLSTYSPGMTEARVVRIASDTSGAIQLVSGVRFGAMAFGRGALNCHDLYIASSAGALIRFEADVRGLPVP